VADDRSEGIWRRLALPVMHRFRSRRGQAILERFPDLGSMRVCDVGGSAHFWESIGLRPGELDVYNIDVTETAPATDDGPSIPIIIYDGEHIPVADGHYDLALSNSVLEHVPPAQRQRFCDEMCRVGREVFLQTPNRGFPIEPHFVFPFIHWLPRSIGRHLVAITPWRILSRLDAATRRSYFDDTHLLSKAELRQLFPMAELRAEKVLGLTKSWYVTVRR
jgi:2-polyprenyl-3-methyl-5-hydroxy-6-metoxy-1,4-benzoquinol methylase